MNHQLLFGNTEKPLIHFAHGNGFPPAAYRHLLKYLTKSYGVICHPFACLRSSKPPFYFHSWQYFLETWEEALDSGGFASLPVVGHSMGGVLSLQLAVKRPELFSALVLLDPLFLSFKERVIWGLLKFIGLSGYAYLPSRQALKRKRVFANPDELFSHYRNKAVFEDFDDENLKAYTEAISEKKAEGLLHLNFSPEWEARVYASYPCLSWQLLKKVSVPVLILTGEKSKVFSSFAAKHLRGLEHVKHIHMEGCGHLLPMERPLEVYKHIQAFFDYSK